jgi:putative FmdB family regulatory protein
MAVYEFECRDCGERFEVKTPMAEHDHLRQQPPPCPKCGRTETRQMVSVFACKTPAG